MTEHDRRFDRWLELLERSGLALRRLDGRELTESDLRRAYGVTYATMTTSSDPPPDWAHEPRK